MAFQRVRKWGVIMVEVAKIRAVDGRARENTSRNGRQHVTKTGKRVGIGQVHGQKLCNCWQNGT
jgi:hypothetical protein